MEVSKSVSETWTWHNLSIFCLTFVEFFIFQLILHRVYNKVELVASGLLCVTITFVRLVEKIKCYP